MRDDTEIADIHSQTLYTKNLFVERYLPIFFDLTLSVVALFADLEPPVFAQKLLPGTDE